MEDHPPLFSPEELNGLPALPPEEHANVTPFPIATVSTEAATVPVIPAEIIPSASVMPEVIMPTTEAPLTSVFNPAEIVLHPAPENTQLSLAEAATKYKEMVGVWPHDELPETKMREAIGSIDAAEKENFRLMEITRREDAEETRKLYRGS